MDSGESNLGNNLNRIVRKTIGDLFSQGELAQLSYSSFDITASNIRDNPNDEIELSYPVGYSATKNPILSKKKYKKEDLIARYSFLAHTQLSINGIYQLVNIVEAMFGDLIRAIVIKYPKKLGPKQVINTGVILEASSLEEIHLYAVNVILNNLSYKSPSDFAVAAEGLISINLLECPAFHRYMEIKASRDIYIHNRGEANDLYVKKASSHARVKSGHMLPIDTVYFMESYEYCIQLSEWIELNLHEQWISSEYEDYKKKIKKLNK